MLGEVARETGELAGEPDGERQPVVFRVEPDLAEVILGERAGSPPPDRARKRRHGVERKAEGLPDFAHRAAGAVVDHGRGESCPLAPVFPVDVLDHLLAALVLEVDVDIGRFVALGADESLEQEIQPVRVDRGDVEAVADRRVGRRPAALAQDAAASGEADDVVDGQEIGGVIELGDQVELVGDLTGSRVWDAVGIAGFRALPGQAPQCAVRGVAGGSLVVRVFVAQLVEREIAGVRNGDAAADGVRMIAKQPRHLGRGFQVAFGIGGEAVAGLVDRAMLADAGQHVGQPFPVGRVRVNVVGRDQRRAGTGGDPGEPVDPRPVVAAIEVARGEMNRIPDAATKRGQIFLEAPVVGAAVPGRQHDQDLARRVIEQVGKPDLALSLGGAAPADREQPRQPAIGGAVAGQAQHAGRVGEVEPRADDELHAGLPRGRMGADDAGQRVSVGHRDRMQTEGGRRLHQLSGVRGAAQKGEVGGRLEFRIGPGHANNP